MWSEEKIEIYLKDRLSEKRYYHTLGVRDTSVKLAMLYNVDVSKARLAALLHDNAKYMSDEEILEIIKSKGYKIDSVCKKSPQLLHGLAGAIIAKQKMDLRDKEIFDAVRYHTTGKKNMSMLEKIIYIADYIEPTRNFAGVEEFRKCAYENLDKVLLIALESSIEYVISKGELLHMDTVNARNYLVWSMK